MLLCFRSEELCSEETLRDALASISVRVRTVQDALGAAGNVSRVRAFSCQQLIGSDVSVEFDTEGQTNVGVGV